MIIFGYEIEGGDRLPAEDEVWRILITNDYKNNVIVWRGDRIESFKLSRDKIFDIEELIAFDKDLARIERLEENERTMLDVSYYNFYYSDEDGNLHFLTSFLHNYERGGKFPNTDKIVNLTLKVQKLLNDNGIDTVIWDEDFIDHLSNGSE